MGESNNGHLECKQKNGFCLVVKENHCGSTVQDALQIFFKEARKHRYNVLLCYKHCTEYEHNDS